MIDVSHARERPGAIETLPLLRVSEERSRRGQVRPFTSEQELAQSEGRLTETVDLGLPESLTDWGGIWILPTPPWVDLGE